MLLTKVFYNQFLLFPSDMKKVLLLLLCAGFQFVTGTVNAGTDMAPITTRPWQETVLSVTDLDSSARFFREIGSYVTKASGVVSASEVASWGLPPAAGGGDAGTGQGKRGPCKHTTDSLYQRRPARTHETGSQSLGYRLLPSA